MTDISKLPPRDQWVATEISLTRWRMAIESLVVCPMADGGRLLCVNVAGREHEFELTAPQARHLARLLAGG